MCNKPCDSIIVNFTLFLIVFFGLAVISGASLQSGGVFMKKQDPENMEYSLYATEPGFLIGVKSAAFFQWITAAFITMFVKVNVSDSEKSIGKSIITIGFQNILSITLFGALHYYSLPVSVQNYANCLDFKEQFSGPKETKIQNPLCEGGRSWESLFTAFSVGASISFVGCLLLQAIYFCLRAACETEVISRIEPITEVSVVVTNTEPSPISVEMIPIPLNP